MKNKNIVNDNYIHQMVTLISIFDDINIREENEKKEKKKISEELEKIFKEKVILIEKSIV